MGKSALNGKGRIRTKTTKLIIGIVSIALFMILIFQSCAAGVANAMNSNVTDSSGGGGVFLAFAMLIAGVVGIATRKSRGGGITAGALYIIGAIIGFANLGTYGDLVVWSVVSAVFGVVFLIGSILMPKSQKTANDNTKT
jgi:hypothetical protein